MRREVQQYRTTWIEFHFFIGLQRLQVNHSFRFGRTEERSELKKI